MADKDEPIKVAVVGASKGVGKAALAMAAALAATSTACGRAMELVEMPGARSEFDKRMILPKHHVVPKGHGNWPQPRKSKRANYRQRR